MMKNTLGFAHEFGGVDDTSRLFVAGDVNKVNKRSFRFRNLLITLTLTVTRTASLLFDMVFCRLSLFYDQYDV
jgi:hypothetical protein